MAAIAFVLTLALSALGLAQDDPPAGANQRHVAERDRAAQQRERIQPDPEAVETQGFGGIDVGQREVVHVHFQPERVHLDPADRRHRRSR